jgi:eukaryotic-like serine/threonine-protein kinase
MQIGQQFGPFIIDKELGHGAMGAVYRGKYTKTGQVVAIKVMAPGYGSTNASANDRFEREVNILKQLKHPNIVRIFGVGKSGGTRYFAMEYVEGESLDRVMARRDRMSWEEVVDLGTQLCAALQHAHEAGIVHRDLKPSNLMILADGTLKLTDFGIAKDLDESQLTSTNCTVGTASYMSPEQCRGDKSITYKSDLYSLGIVFYELVTGRKPFQADSPMEVFLLHVNEPPVRPSKFAMDIPVWMDNLVCHLMEKKPELRPLDANMVSTVLNTIQEKVESQHSAGVDAVTARGGDTRSRRRDATAEDREAARALKGKKSRKKGSRPWHEQAWPKALGLGLVLALAVGAIVMLLQPASADSLYRDAERLMQSENPEKHDEAREKPIKQYLARYGKLDTPQTRQMLKWAEDYDAARYEKLIDRHLRYQKEKTARLAVEAQTKSEELAFKAADAEYDGDRTAAEKLWKEVLEAEGPTGIGALAKRHLMMLNGIEAEFRALGELRGAARDSRSEPKVEGLRGRALRAHRQEDFGDRAGAKRTYELLRSEATTEPVNRFYQLVAAVKTKQLKDSLTAEPQDDKARVDTVAALISRIEKDKKMALLDKRFLAQEVVQVYGKDEDFAAPLKQARLLLDSVDASLGKPSGQ